MLTMLQCKLCGGSMTAARPAHDGSAWVCPHCDTFCAKGSQGTCAICNAVFGDPTHPPQFPEQGETNATDSI